MSPWPLLLAGLLLASACHSRGPMRIDLSGSLPADVPSLRKVADDVPGARPKLLRALAAARRLVTLTPQDAGAHWRAARAAYLLADEARSREDRRRFAEEGARHAERAVTLAPNRVEPHYYLALNLGIVAHVRRMTALDLVPRIAAAARKAVEIAPTFERCGPLRLLGLVYAMAPPWPTSVGDIDEGLRLLRDAVRRHPGEPLNRLFLAEALIADKRHDDAEVQLRKVLAAPPKGDWARVGPRWRKHARRLLKRIEVARHHRDEDS